MDSSIGVLLTSHKRPHTLREQLRAIEAQTVTPEDIIIWHNNGGVRPDIEAMNGRKVIAANYPTGVWSRFAFCLWGFKTEYVCVFDDDTIPGRRWLENCVNQMCKKPALYGANGVIFKHGDRHTREYVGHSSQNFYTVQTDIVGHSWFFRRAWLTYACAHLRPCGEYRDIAGEDYHLSASFQAHGIHTFVPSHPTLERDFWGSTVPQLGADSVALYKQPESEPTKGMIHEFYRSHGWKTLYDMEQG